MSRKRVVKPAAARKQPHRHLLQIGALTFPILGDVVDLPDGGTVIRFYGRCHKCGCTDADCSQCIAATGKPCHWVDEEHTLCSCCANDK